MTRVLLPFDSIADESSEPREIAAPTTISSLRRMRTFVGPKAKVGRGASLSGAVALREVCLVSNGATMKQSVLLLDSSLEAERTWRIASWGPPMRSGWESGSRGSPLP